MHEVSKIKVLIPLRQILENWTVVELILQCTTKTKIFHPLFLCCTHYSSSHPIKIQFCMPPDERYSIKQVQPLIRYNVWQMHPMNHHTQLLQFFCLFNAVKQQSTFYDPHSQPNDKTRNGRHTFGIVGDLFHPEQLPHNRIQLTCLTNCLCKFNS